MGRHLFAGVVGTFVLAAPPCGVQVPAHGGKRQVGNGGARVRHATLKSARRVISRHQSRAINNSNSPNQATSQPLRRYQFNRASVRR